MGAHPSPAPAAPRSRVTEATNARPSTSSSSAGESDWINGGPEPETSGPPKPPNHRRPRRPPSNPPAPAKPNPWTCRGCVPAAAQAVQPLRLSRQRLVANCCKLAQLRGSGGCRVRSLVGRAQLGSAVSQGRRRGHQASGGLVHHTLISPLCRPGGEYTLVNAQILKRQLPRHPLRQRWIQQVVEAQVTRTPCFIYDEATVRERATRVALVATEANVSLLYTLKPFSLQDFLRFISGDVDGFAVSSLFEARLAREAIGESGSVHFTSPGLRPNDIQEVSESCDYISFNSLSQWDRHSPTASRNVSCGIRINPQLSLVF